MVLLSKCQKHKLTDDTINCQKCQNITFDGFDRGVSKVSKTLYLIGAVRCQKMGCQIRILYIRI